MSSHELAIVAEALAASSRVLSEGHALAPRLTAETFVNAFAHMEQIAQERGPITEPDDPTMPEDALVRIDGAWIRWGDLPLAERTTYMTRHTH